MKPAKPEKNKQPGVYYAFTEDGVELPIIDITHPSFQVIKPDNETLAFIDKKTIAEHKVLIRISKPVRRILFWVMSRMSILMRCVFETDGTFLSGMNTYLIKLGPGNLGKPMPAN